MLPSIYKIWVKITDRGTSFDIKPFEVSGDIRTSAMKHLSKYKNAYDLSRSYSFEITKKQFVGYGQL